MGPLSRLLCRASHEGLHAAHGIVGALDKGFAAPLRGRFYRFPMRARGVCIGTRTQIVGFDPARAREHTEYRYLDPVNLGGTRA